MGEVFSRILEMSLYGTIAILAVLLFRLIFKKCPKKILIIFWIVVAVRLLCPFNFNSPTSVLNIGRLFPAKTETSITEEEVSEPVVQAVTDESAGQAGAAADVVVPAEVTDAADVTAATGQKAQKDPRFSFNYIAPIVWFTVTMGLLIFSTIRYALFYSKAKWSSRSYDGRYYMANDIDSPFVVGIFDPKIFFPINMDDDEREYVLNHEWIHIKNKDSLIKLIGYVILCIHWFNPMVWLAFVMLCADIEMRVDEETTVNFDLSMVKEYCKSLVRHASDDKGGAFMQSTAFSGLGFGGMETKLRITNLLKRKETTLGFQIVSLALTIPVVLLVSAASLDHKDTLFEKKPEPVEESAVESTELSASSENSADASVHGYDPGYVDAYIDIVRSYEARPDQMFTYALIYVDGDSIPELVVENPESEFHEYGQDLNLYTYWDGKARTVFENHYCPPERRDGYNYVPNCDFIFRVNEVEYDTTYYYSVYTLDDLLRGNDPFLEGSIVDGRYYVGTDEVTYSEFVDRLKVNSSETVFGIYNGDKILELLGAGNGSNPGSNSADAGITSGITVTPTPSETPSPTPSPAPAMPAKSFSNLADGSVLPFEMDENWNYVLNGDFGDIKITYLASAKVIISVNGNEYVEDVGFRKYTLPYLLKSNGQVYIYWNVYENETYNVRVYYLTDTMATYAGVKESLYIENIDNTDYFWCEELYGDYGLCNIFRSYYVSSNGIPQQKYDYCTFGGYAGVRTRYDMTGYIIGEEGIATDELKTIPAGTEVYLERASDRSSLDVRLTDGSDVSVRLDITEAYELYYYRGYDRWLYDYLCSKFERAY